MTSWMGHGLEIYLKVRKLFTDQAGNLDVTRERAEVETLAKMFKPLEEIQCERTEAGGVPAEWVIPESVVPGRVVLFIHGGSFNSGSLDSHRTLVGNLAGACKARVLQIDYRLAPEHPFPAAVEDVVSAFEWMLGQGTDPKAMLVAGDSAGGTLTLSLLVYLRDHNRPLPKGAICLSPAPDLTFSSESWKFNAKNDLMLDERKERMSVEIYLKGVDMKETLASPYFADLHGLPPLLIQVGSYEMLLSDCERFTAKAKESGVDARLEVWQGMQHEWQFAAKVLPEGRKAIENAGKFADEIFFGKVKE